jgi:hypothetical protein
MAICPSNFTSISAVDSTVTCMQVAQSFTPWKEGSLSTSKHTVTFSFPQSSLRGVVFFATARYTDACQTDTSTVLFKWMWQMR